MENNKIFQLWVNSSMRDFHVFLGVAAVASWLIGNLSKNPNMHVASDMLALFVILHYFIHGYFYRQQKFLSNNQKNYSLPKKKIARCGGMFLGGFMVAVCIGMAIVKEIYTGTFLAKIKAIVYYILATVFGVMIDNGGLESDGLHVNKNMSILDELAMVSQKADSPWEKVIDKVQSILIMVGIVFIILLLIVLVVNYVRRLVENTKIVVENRSGENVVDRESSLWGKEKKREKFLDFSPAAKTRRIYRKCINRYRKNRAIQDWMSPSEIEQIVSVPKEEKYQELHEIYEKARYSEFGCTEDEAKRAKNLKV